MVQGTFQYHETERLDALQFLKNVKNNLVGHRNAKLRFYNEHGIPRVVDYINRDDEHGEWLEVRIEAAHIVATLANGPKDILHGLLTSSTLDAVLSALSGLSSDDRRLSTLRLALLRALRSLGIALADIVGPSLWELEGDDGDFRVIATPVLDCLFEDTTLDIYLSVLSGSELQAKIVLCQMISACTRLARYRTAITGWHPLEERLKHTKGRRGWEDPTLSSSDSPRQGGWVISHLVELLESRDVKAKEASLVALAALTKDNAHLALVLAKSPLVGKESVLHECLSLLRSRPVEVRLAACQCVTNIIREKSSRESQVPVDPSRVLHALTRIISDESETPAHRTRACFSLRYLVADDEKCCGSALTFGTVACVTKLIKNTTPIERPQEWDDGEPLSVLRLRESALMAIAALTLQHNNARDTVTSDGLMPLVSLCLTHPHFGIRYAACHCVRSLSRAVSVLRTSMLDSGVGDILCKIVEDVHEDRRVTNVALMCLCNLLNDFSPLRKTILEKGTMRRLATLSVCPDHSLRLNAVWAIKNCLRKVPLDEERLIISQIGWDKLRILTQDSYDDVKEQVFGAMCNIASTDSGVQEMFNAFRSHEGGLLGVLVAASTSSNDDILHQVMQIFGNIANGGFKDHLAMHRAVISQLHTGIEHPKQDICLAALKCIEALASESSRYPELRAENIDSTLKRISTEGGGTGVSHRPDIDADIRRIAKSALRIMENSVSVTGGFGIIGPYGQ